MAAGSDDADVGETAVETVSTSSHGISNNKQQTRDEKFSQPCPPNGSQEPSAAPAVQRPSVFKRILAKLGFTPIVIMMMVKPAVAATISLAIYQSKAVASHYLNIGYVIIVVSVTTVPILPRGKFLLNLCLCLFLTCFAAAMVSLGQWAGIKARQHTTPAGASPEVAIGYNSSASAVNAIFMIVNVFAINALRAYRPAFSIPGIQYTVFVLVGFSFGPAEPTEALSQKIVKELLYSFLTGQAISTAVSLLIIPVSSRKVFFGEATGFLQTCRKLLKAQLEFAQVLEHSSSNKPTTTDSEPPKEVETDKNVSDNKALYLQKLSALKATSAGILTLGAKLREDVVFAKRELAYGYLRETDIHELHRLLRGILLPISGMSTIADISEKLHCHLPRARQSPGSQLIQDEENDLKEWREIFHAMVVSFASFTQILDDSILHVLILLQLVPVSKKKQGGDIEKEAGPPQPGGANFGDYLEKAIEQIREDRTTEIQQWANDRGLNSVFQNTAGHSVPPRNLFHDNKYPDGMSREMMASMRLHLILYMEYLIYTSGKAILATVRFAESKVEDGTFKRQRLIAPATKTVIKLVKGLFSGENSIPQLEQVTGTELVVQLGDSFQAPKDPEHLPPKNRRQVFGNYMRKIPKFLGSAPMRFGFRVSVAVMSVGIMAFLKNTHVFYTRQRLVWCLIMISIGMSPTAGMAVFNLFGNLFFTLFGMVGSIINYYIVDGKTPGIIVIFFFFLLFYFYFAAKYPNFLIAIVAGALTHVLVIGYELQVRVIGLKQATATGQLYYPIYELAPYRLLTVAGGVIVGYIWTIFPVPITEASVLRRDLGVSLFLLANYASAVTATVNQRLAQTEGDMSLSSSPGRRLQKLRNQTTTKMLLLLQSMKQNLVFLAWEPRLGGDFPKSIYSSIVDEVQNMLNYLSIISYASESFTVAHLDPATSVWISEFSESRIATESESNKLASLLTVLSASIRNAQALPPYVREPTNFRLSNEIVGPKTKILDLKNVNKQGFRAVAVIEVAQGCLVDSAARILALVKELVGEVDFSHHVINSPNASSLLGSQGDGKQKVF